MRYLAWLRIAAPLVLLVGATAPTHHYALEEAGSNVRAKVSFFGLSSKTAQFPRVVMGRRGGTDKQHQGRCNPQPGKVAQSGSPIAPKRLKVAPGGALCQSLWPLATKALSAVRDGQAHFLLRQHECGKIDHAMALCRKHFSEALQR